MIPVINAFFRYYHPIYIYNILLDILRYQPPIFFSILSLICIIKSSTINHPVKYGGKISIYQSPFYTTEKRYSSSHQNTRYCDLKGFLPMHIPYIPPLTGHALGDLVPLLAQARRDYDAALQRGDLGAAVRYERIYKVLFERRRRALLVQATQRYEAAGGVA